MKIKKFQKPADLLDNSKVSISPEREKQIRESQQSALNTLWQNRDSQLSELERLNEANKTDEDRYLEFLDKHDILYADDYDRQMKLQQLGYSEGRDSDGNPILYRNSEQPLQPKDFDFALTLTGLKGTQAAARAVGWLPTIAEEIGASVVGTGATYGSDYLGQAIDNRFGTNVRPWLTLGGGLTGAFLGGHWGNKGAMKTAKYAVDNGIRGYGDFHPAIQEEILKTPKSSAEPLLNVGWAPAQTMNIRRAGELGTMYYPSRWDVTNEGANPFGVWLQGKYGVPRTDITNPGKGEKADRARQIFENRPQYVGNVSFKKPIQTVGEVPDRSVLSYDAERIGADGIIYNNVYDNGWNNNQVVFSFNRPKLSESSNAAPRIMWMGPTTRTTIDDIPVQTDYMQAPPSTPIFDPNGYETKIRNWWFFDKNKTINDDITVDDLRDFVDSRIIRNGNNINISAADAQLRKNFAEFIDDLTQANTYHPELGVNDIMKEFDLMARRESPMDVDNYSHISDYFTHDAYPRLMNSFKRSGIDLKPEEMDDIYQMYSHPFRGVNISIGYTVPGTGGFSRGPNTIRFSNRYSPTWNYVSDSTIVHELHHSLRNRLGRYLKSKGYDINPGQDWLPEVLESGSASRNNNIRGQYLPSEMEIMKPLAMSKEFVDDKTPVAEIGAVAAGDARWPLWNQKRMELGRIPSINELDQHMDELPATYFYSNAPFLPYGTQIGSAQENAFRAFEKDTYRRANLTNAVRNSLYKKIPWYKKPFVKKPEPLLPNLYMEHTEHMKNMSKAWKDAIKYIGGATGAAVGLNGINTQIENNEDYN